MDIYVENSNLSTFSTGIRCLQPGDKISVFSCVNNLKVINTLTGVFHHTVPQEKSLILLVKTYFSTNPQPLILLLLRTTINYFINAKEMHHEVIL